MASIVFGASKRISVSEISSLVESLFHIDLGSCTEVSIIQLPLVCIGAAGRQCERLVEADGVFCSRDGDIGQGQYGEGDVVALRAVVAAALCGDHSVNVVAYAIAELGNAASDAVSNSNTILLPLVGVGIVASCS